MSKLHSAEADELDQLCRKMNDVRVKGISEKPALQDLSLEQFEALKKQLSSDQLHAALTEFRKLLAHDNIHPYLDRILSIGVLSKFVEALQTPSDEVKFESAWILTNIAAGSTMQTKAVVDEGAVKVLVDILSTSQNIQLKEQVVWCLANITGDSVPMRTFVLESGALQPLLNLIKSEMDCYLASDPIQQAEALGVSPRKNKAYNLSTLRICMWALSNFCRGNGSSDLDWNLIEVALPVLSHVIVACEPNTSNCDDEILMDACWALSRILRGIHEGIDKVLVNVDVCRILGFLVTYQSPEVQVPALRCLINVVSGSDTQTQQVLDAGVLVNLLHLLTYPTNDTILKEACLIISNITAGSPSQVQAVLNVDDGRIINRLIDLMQQYPDLKVRKECCWALSNACSNKVYEQIDFMVQSGLVGAMQSMLSVSGLDSKMVQKCLESMKNVLVCGECNKRAAVDLDLQVLDIQKDSAYSSQTSLEAAEDCHNPYATLISEQKLKPFSNYPLVRDILQML